MSLAPELPWIHVYGRTPPQDQSAEQYKLGWLAGKAARARQRCPFPKGSIARAAYMGARAFHRELDA